MPTAQPSRVAKRYLEKVGSGPPRPVGSARLLRRQGIHPVDVFFGEVRDRPNRTLIVQGEFVQHRPSEKVFYFVGVDHRGRAVLAKNEREYDRMRDQLESDRQNWETPTSRAAGFVPGQVDEDGYTPGTVNEVVEPEGVGSQVPPARNRDGEES